MDDDDETLRGWNWFPSAFDVSRKSDCRAYMPRFWCANLALAVACGQLGEHEQARTAL
jgi:hypothetical protein